MGHADNHVLDTKLTTALDDLFHRGDQRFTTVQTKAFGAHIFYVQELFETLGFDQLFQDSFAPGLGELDFLAIAFDPFL